jgi:two-component system NtrC family sensor kinase
MARHTTTAGRGPENFQAPDIASDRRPFYSRLFRRFVGLTLLCSVVPLLVVGWAINLHYTNFARERMLNSLQTQVDYHRKLIERFLNEHTSKLQLIARTHDRDALLEPGALQTVFDLFNQDLWTLTDLSLIGEHGYHLGYVGSYDLWSKNYSKEFWFAQVMQKGIYISDMFLGFRKEPHFIIAVTHMSGGSKWILRATINTDVFRSLVENVRIGKTGEVYLLNEKGIYQTSPRLGGEIMEKSTYPIGPDHAGIQIHMLDRLKDSRGREQPRQIACQTWLKNPRWLLVVQQEYAEALADVNHANTSTLIFLLLSAASILVVAVLITRHMITIIRRRDAEAERLNEQLLQAGKLASIGELSAGVAHEINNPLAIILTERQLLLDATGNAPIADPEFQEQFSDSMSQIDIQVQRCKRITQNLLRFSRRTESVIETVDLNGFVREVIDLMDREARTSGIKFFSELDPQLPPLLSDPSQLQQVLLNLITNAIDAHDGKSYGSIRISTRADSQRQQAVVVVSDTGAGIKPEHLRRIFDPFFTTKAARKGTGLGLSICYSTVRRLGGSISVRSEPGKGSEFTIVLPFRPPKELQESIAEGNGAAPGS